MPFWDVDDEVFLVKYISDATHMSRTTQENDNMLG